MRLPRTPFMFFRFANKPAGQILIHTGRGRGARANMAKHVAAVDDLCYVLMDASSKMAYATRAGAPPPTPKDGNLASLFDGERYTRWTCMTDREIIRISRYATGCVGGPQ
jgi:hypothetical protein